MRLVEAKRARKSEDVVGYSSGEEVYFLLIYSSPADRASILQELHQDFPQATVVLVPYADDCPTFESIYLPKGSTTVISLLGLGLIASCRSSLLQEFVDATKTLGASYAQ